MCLYLQTALLNTSGKIQMHSEGNLKIPCGKCSECISKRSFEWALRARHEISTHKNNTFLTLTYNQESLPSLLLVKTHFQKFIKRLRKNTNLKIRYMVSHEYGSKTFRPHHHCIIFGYSPNKQTFLKTTNSGEKIFTSPELDKLWPHGFHSIGTANEKTAYYIASYSLKGKKHTFTCPATGEIIKVSDCMDVSKRPAIGYQYFTRNYKQMIDSETNLPRYYFKKLETLNPTLHEQYENSRMLLFKQRSAHELYAKFTIDQHNPHKAEFRETCLDTKTENEYLKIELKNNRDAYVATTTGTT